jgi:hypothetical protein
MPDTTYDPLTYRKQGGNEFVVASGGVLRLEAGSAVKSTDGTDLDLLKRYQSIDIADGSAEATYYLTAKHAGKITLIDTITDAATSTADITLTFSINGVAITTGVVTIATSASAAGDQDSCTPSALNTVAVGDKISCVVTGGGAGGSPRVHANIEITAQ